MQYFLESYNYNIIVISISTIIGLKKMKKILSELEYEQSVKKMTKKKIEVEEQDEDFDLDDDDRMAESFDGFKGFI